MSSSSLIEFNAPQLVPIRQVNGSLKIVSVNDFVWPELKLVLENNRPEAVITFLPPERHMEPLILSVTMAVGIPLACGSVYDLPWTVQAYIYSGATCILSEAKVLPYLLKALKNQSKATTPQQIILIKGSDEDEFTPEAFDLQESEVLHLSNPLSHYVSE